MSRSSYRLANQILDFVRDARFGPGHHLREQHVSEMLGVSRTPARAALSLLEKQGILESRKNQGFFLKAGPQELHAVDMEVPTTAEQDLYAKIVDERLSGKLGESFTQSEIARRYEVDRALLQKVLTQLENDGLLSRNSGRGWTFQPTIDSQIALRSSYDFRKTIEPAGILLDTFQVDSVALEKARRQHLFLEAHPNIGTVRSTLLFETDAQFHEMIAEFSGNNFFVQAIQQQNRMRRLLEFGGYANRRRVKDWCREHLKILDAIGSGDRRAAAQLMAEHLNAAFRAAPKKHLDIARS
ncbi:GntR family transcriptional regulator [Bradyrhizobium sp. WSM2793]|uniref:GntR family transcriptional regulator n=1 Tax=Bradyrhizobium sp. WSM2793 TaxID=1038866 RepID=UPI000676A72F|nr:GntR family transcriptional regulator [Bradyrhizobium sp. WSM2793]